MKRAVIKIGGAAADVAAWIAQLVKLLIKVNNGSNGVSANVPYFIRASNFIN